jgi:hypothetical protein
MDHKRRASLDSRGHEQQMKNGFSKGTKEYLLESTPGRKKK